MSSELERSEMVAGASERSRAPLEERRGPVMRFNDGPMLTPPDFAAFAVAAVMIWGPLAAAAFRG